MIFIIAALFLFSQVVIKSQRDAFIFRLLAIALIFIFMLNAINPNAFIASHNLKNPKVGNIDPVYLENLGLDASLTFALETQYHPDDLQCSLRRKLQAEINRYDAWYAWSYSLYQARKAMDTWKPTCHYKFRHLK